MNNEPQNLKEQEINESVEESTQKSQEPQVIEKTVVKKDPYAVDPREVVTDFMNPVVWKQMQAMAKTFVESGALPESDNAARVMMKFQAGREMGMTPTRSIKAFYFVNGSMNLYGAETMRRLREHGWSLSYKDEANKCTATIKNESGEEYSDSLTFEEAEKSGWTKGSRGLKPGWYEGVNRRLKLRYGALSIVIKSYVPEVLGSASDIAEVAMDYAPVIEEYREQVSVPETSGEPATDDQMETLKSVAPETYNGWVDSGTERPSKAEAARMIKEAVSGRAKKGGE